MMVKQNAIVTGCQQYLTEITSNASPYYSPVNLPNGTSNLHKDDCATATKQLLIVSGIIIFVGNFIQVKSDCFMIDMLKLIIFVSLDLFCFNYQCLCSKIKNWFNCSTS